MQNVLYLLLPFVALAQTITPLTYTVTYTREVVIPTASAYALEAPIMPITETLEAKIDRIATAHKIATTTLYNLVESESQFDTKARGRDGEVGLVQIMPLWGFSVEQMEDPEFSLNFAAEKLANGQEDLWTVCSCKKFAVAMGSQMTRGNADDIFPNTPVPIVGGVIILKYPSGRHHLAPITKDTIQPDGYHITTANKEPCKITSEVLPLNSKLIMGFYRYANDEK